MSVCTPVRSCLGAAAGEADEGSEADPPADMLRIRKTSGLPDCEPLTSSLINVHKYDHVIIKLKKVFLFVVLSLNLKTELQQLEGF